MLSIISRQDHGILTQISIVLFPLVTMVNSLPISFVVVRENLFHVGIRSKPWIFILTLVIPWLVALVLQNLTDYLDTLISWCSLVFVSAVNFILPFIFYLFSDKRIIALDHWKLNGGKFLRSLNRRLRRPQSEKAPNTTTNNAEELMIANEQEYQLFQEPQVDLNPCIAVTSKSTTAVTTTAEPILLKKIARSSFLTIVAIAACGFTVLVVIFMMGLNLFHHVNSGKFIIDV